ncbi:hypothetical protein GRF29_213g1342390 [Pseudopithomyces chartarum]|uniref:Uncharacterized protein n=1 Tax=Pseudopithomyces chartarum TaxID=1892770 RepID=A0AAN6LNZ7_9PLEO|nr:hypothetical protein GRF29_213g1342390 [Pseudopithomyces chartarum]
MAPAKKTTSSGRKATTISRYSRNKDKRAQPQKRELSLAFKTVKKPSIKAHNKRTNNPCSKRAKDTTGTTTAAIEKILLAEHEIHIAWQKKELGRAEKTAACRQAKLPNSGFVNSKGQRICPNMQKSSTIKVEKGSADTKGSSATLLNLLELRNDKETT